MFTCDDLGLSEDDLLGDAALPLVQLLTDAGDHTETTLQSVGGLLTNELKHTHKHVITKCTQEERCVSYSSKDILRSTHSREIHVRTESDSEDKK